MLEKEQIQQQSDEPVLILDRVNKYFKKQGTFFKAINEATFKVNQGDFFGIIGESGSGKSTTGKLIIRLLSASGGTIVFDNNLISQKKISKKTAKWLTQNMQMIFQDPMSSLNPKKNVLNLISEPFRINKKLHKEATDIIKNHRLINPFFQYTFKESDYEKSQEFNENYYKPMIELHKKYLALIKDYHFEENESMEEVLYDLLGLLSKMEEEAKLINNVIYDYTQSIKDIYTKCLNKLLNKENHPLEVALFLAKQNKKNLKKFKFNAPEYWQTLALKEKNQQEFDNYVDEFVEKYTKQGGTFLSSIQESFHSDLSALRQEFSISHRYTNYLYLKVQILGLKIFLNAFKEVKSLEFLSISQIQELTQELKAAAEYEIIDLLNKVIELKDLEKQKDDFFNMMIKKDLVNQTEIDLINNADLRQLSSNKNLEQLIINKFNEHKAEYLELLVKIQNLIEEIEGLFKTSENLKLEEMLIIHSIVNKAKNISYETNLEYVDKVSFYKNLDLEYSKKIDQILANRKLWKKSDAFKKADADYLKAEQELKQADIECNAHYAEDIKEFNQSVAPKIQAHKKELKELQKDLNKLRIQYKIAVFKLAQKAINLAWKINQNPSFFKKVLSFFEQRKNINREIFTRLKNQSALKFEFETSMEEVYLFRLLRSKNKLIHSFNKRFLVQVLIRSKAYEALGSVGLKNEHAYRYPHEFSGGQRQRIVIARALINNPKLIIADEPISALDVSIQAQVINIMKNLAKEKGITFLFVAHDLSMVNYACNRMIIMHNGRIVEKGNTNEIFRNPIHPYTQSLIKAAPQLSKIHVDLASFSQLENYTADYSILNKPDYYKIEKDSEHYVYCTQGQLEEWEKHQIR